MDDLQFALDTRKHSSMGFTLVFFNLGRELQAVQSLDKDLGDKDEIKYQDIEKWTERMRKLHIIIEEVVTKLDTSSNNEAKLHNSRRRLISFELGEQVLCREKRHSNKAGSTAKKPNFYH